MNLSFLEYEPQKVLEAFRRGEFDNLEVIGLADERDDDPVEYSIWQRTDDVVCGRHR